MSEKKNNLVELGFMDARIKLIDIAAFLDRIDRHEQSDDYRVSALKEACRNCSVMSRAGQLGS